MLIGATLAAAALVPATARTAAGGSDLPFSATMAGTGSVSLVTGQAHNELSANASHFGLSRLEEFSQIVPVSPGTFLSIGRLTLTAANGDSLTGTASGTGTTADGVHFTFALHVVLGNGTGRLAGSSLAYDVTVHSTTVGVQGTTATNALEATASGSFNR